MGDMGEFAFKGAKAGGFGARIVGFEVVPMSVKHEWNNQWNGAQTYLKSCNGQILPTVSSPIQRSCLVRRPSCLYLSYIVVPRLIHTMERAGIFTSRIRPETMTSIGSQSQTQCSLFSYSHSWWGCHHAGTESGHLGLQ